MNVKARVRHAFHVFASIDVSYRGGGETFGRGSANKDANQFIILPILIQSMHTLSTSQPNVMRHEKQILFHSASGSTKA